MRRTTRRRLAALATAGLLMTGLGACAGDEETTNKGDPRGVDVDTDESDLGGAGAGG